MDDIKLPDPLNPKPGDVFYAADSVAMRGYLGGKDNDLVLKVAIISVLSKNNKGKIYCRLKYDKFDDLVTNTTDRLCSTEEGAWDLADEQIQDYCHKRIDELEGERSELYDILENSFRREDSTNEVNIRSNICAG